MRDQLTENDIKKIEEEIEYRKLVVRKEAIEAVKEARAQGDLSENFEYYAAKRDKNKNESRIRYLERMIRTAEVVSDESREDEVGINNTVELYMEEDEITETYKLVTSVRGNSLEGKISTESPLGKAILGHKVNDRVYVRVNDNYGYYVVVNQSSGNRVLDVAGGSSSAGARVQLYTANGTNAQKWYVRSLGNGAYSLTAFVSGKSLDVPSANASNGASVQQWDWNGSGAQKWLLRLADCGGIAIYSMLADGSFALMDSDNGLILGNGGGDSWRFDTTIVSEQPYADANGAQRRLVDIAYSTPTPGANLCSEWISRVFNAAGYGYAYGDACDMFWSYCHDSNRANLKVGMIVAVPSHSHNWAGSRWGHIAIYIGDGKVIENIGRVNVRGLNDWVNYYGTTYTPLWGWYRNIALC